MKLRIEVQRRYDPILRRMAQEAGVRLEDLAEAAIYNLIALYVKEVGVEVDQAGGLPITLPPGDVDPVGLKHRDDVASADL